MTTDAGTETEAPTVEQVYFDVNWDSSFYMGGPDADPDGDLGASFTAEQVIEKLKECGSKKSAIDDWQLLDSEEANITVTVKMSDGTRTTAEW